MRETGEREWGSSPHEVVELGGVGERAVWHVNDHVTREFNCTAPPHHRRKREQVEGRGREELRCGSWFFQLFLKNTTNFRLGFAVLELFEIQKPRKRLEIPGLHLFGIFY